MSTDNNNDTSSALDVQAKEWLQRFMKLNGEASGMLHRAEYHHKRSQLLVGVIERYAAEKDRIREELAKPPEKQSLMDRVRSATFNRGQAGDAEAARAELERRLNRISGFQHKHQRTIEGHERQVTGHLILHQEAHHALEQHIKTGTPDIRNRAAALARQVQAEAVQIAPSAVVQDAKKWLDDRTEYRQGMSKMAEQHDDMRIKIGRALEQNRDDLSDAQVLSVEKTMKYLAGQASQIRDAAYMLTVDTQNADRAAPFTPTPEAARIMAKAEYNVKTMESLHNTIERVAINNAAAGYTITQDASPNQQQRQRASAGMSM